MTSRERVLNCLHHQEPDRVPFDLGSTLVTGVTDIAYKNLLSHLGIGKEKINICDITQQLAEVDEELLQRLRVDMRGVFLENFSNWEFKLKEDEDNFYFEDAWGVTWKRPKAGGYDFIPFKHPLSKASSLRHIDAYSWPDPVDCSRIRNLQEKIVRKKKQGYTVILGSVGMSVGLFQTATWLQGFEECYANLAANPSLMSGLLDKLVELDMKFWDFFITEVKDHPDVILYADDFGIQNGLLISSEMFRKYFKPRYKKIFTFIKSRCSAYILFHTCGSVYELIPELIEMGVDILNPVQVSAANMDTKRLKKEFGEDIVFWGGGVDTQKILPFGNPQEVRDEVKRRIDDLAPGGGFVFAPVHNIQPDVPPQNIMAMWETLQEFGEY